jgi:UDP-2-acetamido-3-amino-2,3-dideoxy-glucuronate N-acetyltransferase
MSFFVHKSSYVDEGATIGNNSKIWHFSHVQKNAAIGNSCILGQNVNVASNVVIGNYVKIQNNVSIYQGVELEDYVFCGPSMVFTNVKLPRAEFPETNSKNYLKTLVKKSASIGANATIVCGVTIGEYAMIGSGAVVTKDVPPFTLVVGNPARILCKIDKYGKSL